MTVTDVLWRPGDEDRFDAQLYTADGTHASALTIADDRIAEWQLTAGTVDGHSNLREVWELEDTEGVGFIRTLLGPRRSWYSGEVQPQHGVALHMTEDATHRTAIIVWQNITFGFWWTLNVGVWRATLAGGSFSNRQVNLALNPLVHTVNVTAAASRSGGVVTAPVAAGHLLKPGDPVVVNLTDDTADGMHSVSAVTATTVSWEQAGADDANLGTGTLAHMFDYWLDVAVVPGTTRVMVRAWKDTPGATPPDWVEYDEDAGVTFDGAAGSYVSRPDLAALDITGTVTLVTDIAPDSWRPSFGFSLLSKFGTSNPSNQRSYRSRLMPTGVVDFSWSTAGSVGITLSGTVPLPNLGNGVRGAVATQFIPNDGAGNKRLAIYTAPTFRGPWTLHEEVVQAGTTSLFAGTAPLELGAVNSGALERFGGRIHYASVISGTLAAGSRVAEFAPMNYPNGNTTLTDLVSGTWTLAGGTAHVNTGIPGSATAAFAVDLDMAGTVAARAAAPTPLSGSAGIVVAHLGTNAQSRVTQGVTRFATADTLVDGQELLGQLAAVWPPSPGGVPMPAARWRRRRGRR